MKGRVLVIEDDQDISLGIRTVLSRQGLEVDSSPDGKQGLRAFHLARPEPFDLVVLDIGLPADRKSTRLNSSHQCLSRMPSSA